MAKTLKEAKISVNYLTSSTVGSRWICSDNEMLVTNSHDLFMYPWQMIKDAFKKKKNVTFKSSPRDLVTETDTAVEKFLFAELRKVFVDHRYDHLMMIYGSNMGKQGTVVCFNSWTSISHAEDYIAHCK